jgi:hypothetical protein
MSLAVTAPINVPMLFGRPASALEGQLELERELKLEEQAPSSTHTRAAAVTLTVGERCQSTPRHRACTLTSKSSQHVHESNA